MKRENIQMAYIKICMLSFLLFGFVDSISSKDFNSGEELNGNSSRIVSDSLRIGQNLDSISVLAAGSCVNTFENSTVSSMISVQGCNTLTVKNVTITNNGNLTLSAPDAVLINGFFEAQLGSVLNIKKKEASIVEFIYNAAGNRILRRVVY